MRAIAMLLLLYEDFFVVVAMVSPPWQFQHWTRDVHGHGMMGTVGIPWISWDSHWNGRDSDYIMGMGMEVGIKVREWE